jgi:hypothetical protein
MSTYTGFLSDIVNHENSVAETSWSSVRDAASCTTATHGNTFGASPAVLGQAVIYCGGTTNKFQWISRFSLGFDTSSIGAGKTITAATLYVSSFKNKYKTYSSTDFAINIFEYTGSITAGNVGDFSKYGTTALCDTDQPYGSGEPRTFTLNAAGLAVINPTGTTKFGIRESRHDAANSAIWGAGNSYVDWENRNESDPWILTVTYEVETPSNVLFRMT